MQEGIITSTLLSDADASLACHVLQFLFSVPGPDAPKVVFQLQNNFYISVLG